MHPRGLYGDYKLLKGIKKEKREAMIIMRLASELEVDGTASSPPTSTKRDESTHEDEVFDDASHEGSQLQ
jgi:hypothetical protein